MAKDWSDILIKLRFNLKFIINNNNKSKKNL